jgi:hypothetical protein
VNVRSLSTLAAAAGLAAAGTADAQAPAKLTVPVPTPAAGAAVNQQLAEAVAQKLAMSGAAQAADVSVSVTDGVVTLTGVCRDDACRTAVVQEVRTVAGVKKVRDGLTVGGGVMQAQAIGTPTSMPAMGPLAGPAMFGQPPAGGGTPIVEPVPLGAAGMTPHDGAAPPLPPNAWPTYAPHNNVSRVGYPTAYPYNAFPFIGPFYPFPKVPLGWRRVLLEWEDGHWWIGKTQAPHDYWRVRFW